jgi:hypothetical protein
MAQGARDARGAGVSHASTAAPAAPRSHLPGVRYIADPVDGVELVRVPDAAAIAGVSTRTVYGWIARKLVEVRYTPTGAVRVVVESLFRDEKE